MATKKTSAKKASGGPARPQVDDKKKSASKKDGAKRAVSAKQPTGKSAAEKTVGKVEKKADAAKQTPKKAASAPSVPAKKSVGQVKSPSAPVTKSAAAPKPSPSPSPENLSADERKKLASQRMWELVQQKKKRATQSPSWRTIEHHDHPAPQGGQGGMSDQSAGASMPSEMPGHRERGSS